VPTGTCFMNTLYFLAQASTVNDSSSAAGGVVILILLFLIGVAIWWIPGFIASARKHHNCVSIWLVTLFLGWSFIGWVIALVWAFSNPSPAQPIVIHNNHN
jgi:T4 superinfection immunity protein